MAKYSPEFNKELRRTVKSFNQKIRRAEARGVKGLPEIRSVRELKAQFAVENDLKREMESLKTLLNNKEALQRRRLKEGTVSNWQYDYIVRNLEETKRKVDRELERTKERQKDVPEYLFASRADLATLEARKESLSRDIDTLTADELRTVGAIVRRYKRTNIRVSNGRKYFMETLDQILAFKDVDIKERREIARKLNELTNEEFHEFYKRHDVVTDVFVKIPSPKKEQEFQDDAETKAIVKEFTEDLDKNIKDVQEALK